MVSRFSAIPGVRALDVAEQRQVRGGFSNNKESRADCIRQAMRDYAAARRTGVPRAEAMATLQAALAICNGIEIPT